MDTFNDIYDSNFEIIFRLVKKTVEVIKGGGKN